MSVSALRIARRIVVSVVGFTVLAIGVAMIVLPGPAVIMIPAGLAILGTEYLWARRFLAHVRARAARLASRGKQQPERTTS